MQTCKPAVFWKQSVAYGLCSAVCINCVLMPFRTTYHTRLRVVMAAPRTLHDNARSIQLELTRAAWPDDVIQCSAAGWLILYHEGASARVLHRMRCDPGRTIRLDVRSRQTWHVHWYPYLVEQDPRSRRVVNSRRAMLRLERWMAQWPDATEFDTDVRLPLLGHEKELPHGPALHLTFHVTALPLSDSDNSVQEEAMPCESTPLDVSRPHIDAHVREWTALLRDVRPGDALRSHPIWDGPFVNRGGSPLPSTVFTQYAQANWLVTTDVLHHWVHMAVERMGLGHRDRSKLSIEERLELVAEVATTRLWSMVYQLDRSGTDEPVDDWWFPFESPDPVHAAYDCEDGVLEALNVLRDLQHMQPMDAWTRCVAHAARFYAFCMAVVSIRPGGKGITTWHAMVVGFPREWLRRKVCDEQGQDRRPPPLVVIECTEYTTSSWSMHEDGRASGHAFASTVTRERASHPITLSQVKAPLRAIHASKQYLSIHTLLLPEELVSELECAEVLLCPSGDTRTYGVVFEAFVADPDACTWRRGPRVTKDRQDAFRGAQTQLAPRVSLHRHSCMERSPTVVCAQPPVLVRDIDVVEGHIQSPDTPTRMCICANPWMPSEHVVVLQTHTDHRAVDSAVVR